MLEKRIFPKLFPPYVGIWIPSKSGQLLTILLRVNPSGMVLKKQVSETSTGYDNYHLKIIKL